MINRRVRLLVFLLTVVAALPLQSRQTVAQTPTRLRQEATSPRQASAMPTVTPASKFAMDGALVESVDGDAQSAAPALPGYTVVLRTIVEVPVTFRVEIHRILSNHTLERRSSFAGNETIPEDQRQFRFEVPKNLPVGIYLIRVSQFKGAVSRQGLLRITQTEQIAGTPRGRMPFGTVVYTPVVRLALDPGTAVGSLTTAINSQDRVSTGEKFYVNVETRDIVETDATHTNLDVKFTLQRTDGSQVWPQPIIGKVNKGNRKHTVKLYATLNGKKDGGRLEPGQYKLTAERVEKEIGETQGPVSIDFNIE